MKNLLSEKELAKTIAQLAVAILKKHKPFSEIILVGIQTRGVVLAQRIIDCITRRGDSRIAPTLGILDINLYRDDLSTVSHVPIVKKTQIPVSIEGQGIILVDDVLYTGRTVRAALDALIDYGRPRFIELAVLVDRGGRELPIEANYVGLKYVAHPQENVKVCFEQSDQTEKVIVL